MAVITVATTKGGAGKTTLVEAMSGDFVRRGYTVGLIDADPSQALTGWCRRAVEVGQESTTMLPEVTADNIIQVISANVSQHDVILIDLEGTTNQEMLMAMSRSDLVIIPVQPSLPDVAAAATTLKQVKNASSLVGHDISVRVIMSRTPPMIQTHSVRHARDMMVNHKMPMMSAEFVDRTAFKEMSFNGRAPSLHSTNANAAANIIAIVDEMMPMIAQEQ